MTATFSEPVTSSSITMALRDSNDTPVSGTKAYDSGHPTGHLHALVGAEGFRDLHRNRLRRDRCRRQHDGLGELELHDCVRASSRHNAADHHGTDTRIRSHWCAHLYDGHLDIQ